MRINRYILVLLLAFLPLTAVAECDGFWRVREVVRADLGWVDLTYERRVVARISGDWFRALDIVHAKIDAASGLRTRLLFCDDADANAFAWSERGRHFVALTLGMYRLLGDDWHAYAAVLGHESAHLTRQHGRRQQRRQETVAAWGELLGLSLLAGKRGRGAAVGLEGVRLGAAAFVSRYSRGQEHEADVVGMGYAHAAGFDSRGALAFHAKMKSASGFLSSHPSSVDRIRKLKSVIRKRGW